MGTFFENEMQVFGPTDGVRSAVAELLANPDEFLVTAVNLGVSTDSVHWIDGVTLEEQTAASVDFYAKGWALSQFTTLAEKHGVGLVWGNHSTLGEGEGVFALVTPSGEVADFVQFEFEEGDSDDEDELPDEWAWERVCELLNTRGREVVEAWLEEN